MKRRPFSGRVHANLIFQERLPGEESLDPVQWQMPDDVFRLLDREARRQHTDLNSFIRDFVCAALRERAEAILRITVERDSQAGDA